MSEIEERVFVINKYKRKRGINGTILEEQSLIVQGKTMKETEKMFDKRWENELKEE